MGIQHATTETHGPMRKVVGVKDYTSAHGNHFDHEVLECGHDGEVLTQYRKLGKRRRCWLCQWLKLKEETNAAASQS